MKLTSLRALVAAIEEGSLRSAARRLGVSQPALTKLIRELETELGTTLLLRSTTGVVATAQGVVLYERACTAERELQQAV
ncbi:MAG: LysR family transcriptional regulator, partial [Aquincola sp.]|nr:LysR family transcriptional regulator [Aquincola sp.]